MPLNNIFTCADGHEDSRNVQRLWNGNMQSRWIILIGTLVALKHV